MAAAFSSFSEVEQGPISAVWTEPRPAPGNGVPGSIGRLEQQVAQLLRAAAFLARDPAAVRGDRPMPRRVMGNGLRELDIFLVDIVAEAAGLRRARRVYCAAEAWRRAGLAEGQYRGLVQLRAAQNRMTFEPARGLVGPPYPLALACAVYSALGLAVLEGVRGSEGDKGDTTSPPTGPVLAFARL